MAHPLCTPFIGFLPDGFGNPLETIAVSAVDASGLLSVVELDSVIDREVTLREVITNRF